MGLTIVEIGDPVLRAIAKPLSKEEILSEEVQVLIEKLKNKLWEVPAVGIAAPQVGQSLQIILVEDKADYHVHLTPQQLEERERVPVPLHILINPVLRTASDEEVEFFEGCLSIPGLLGVVPRARVVQVEYLNEKAEPKSILAQGWLARILQHEIDHLNGVLFVDKIKTKTITTLSNFQKYGKHLSKQDIKLL